MTSLVTQSMQNHSSSDGLCSVREVDYLSLTGSTSWDLHHPPTPTPNPHQYLFGVGGGGGIVLACEDFGRMFDHSFPVCAFF